MNNINTKQAYLSFRLNKELFAVSAFNVLEVLEKQHITQIPQAPEYILGIINFRGEVLPVVNTRRKFRMPEIDENQKYVIIVLDLKINNENIQLGAVVDGVKDVLEIDEQQLKDVPKMGVAYNSEFIKGMVHIENTFIMILNVDKIFSQAEVELISDSVQP